MVAAELIPVLDGEEDYKCRLTTSFRAPVEGTRTKQQQISNGMHRTHRILTPQELAQGRKTRWMELEISGTVRSLSPALWRLRHLTALFVSSNQLTRVPPQISCLCNLTVLDLSHNKLRSLPAELGDMISLCHLHLNYNTLRVLPYELGKLFRLGTLGLHGNPLSPELNKLYHERDGTQKVMQFLLDHLAINTVPPPERQWIMLHRIDRERPIATFTVLCYNVLCDKYATASLYSYCPSWALNWQYRKKAILQEIRSYDCDILTLQEVETEQFAKFFLPELESNGYSGIFSAKSRAKTMSDEDKKYVDGCAIFWKVDKFELDKEQLIEFTQMAIETADGSEHMLNRVMTRDNIALAAVLKIKEGIYGNSMLPPPPHENLVGNPVVVCTAHIHWDPEFCDVKLVQTMMLVHELSMLVDQVARTWRMNPAQVPLMVCGDLNSLPNSGVFEFMTKGKVPANHDDFKGFRDKGSCLQKLSAASDPNSYTHSFRLESAYDTNTIPFTNFTLDFKGIIDYIFASPSSLYKLGVLGPLEQSWLQSNKIIGCPHLHIPSDHIPILSQYAIVPPHLQRVAPPPPQHPALSASHQLGQLGR